MSNYLAEYKQDEVDPVQSEESKPKLTASVQNFFYFFFRGLKEEEKVKRKRSDTDLTASSLRKDQNTEKIV